MYRIKIKIERKNDFRDKSYNALNSIKKDKHRHVSCIHGVRKSLQIGLKIWLFLHKTIFLQNIKLAFIFKEREENTECMHACICYTISIKMFYLKIDLNFKFNYF